MTLPTQTAAQSVTAQQAAWQAATGIVPVWAAGDPLLALFEAFANQGDFLQAIAATINNLTRAQTSTGADLDSWMAQFYFTRLPATFASTAETFSVLAPPSSPISIPAATLVNGVYTGGTLVQNAAGTVQFQVIPDTTQSAYVAASNSYVLGTTVTSITATVQALTAGSAANLAAGQLSQMASAVPGIASVTNASAIASGLNAESDAAFLARFPGYLASLGQATRTAILAAAADVQQGLSIFPVEQQDNHTNPLLGSFTLYVDDGSGDPPSTLLTNVFNAVNAARAFGIQCFVAGPNVLTATIVLTIRPATGYTISTLGPAVQSAVVAAVQKVATGATLFVSAVEAAALSVAGVAAVRPGTTINAVNADLIPSATQEIRTATADVTVGQY